MGRLLDRVSPHGDTLAVLASDAHLRPLLKLTNEQQDAAITLARRWANLAGF